MRAYFVLLLFVLAVSGELDDERENQFGRSLNRDVRQLWVFPDQLGRTRPTTQASSVVPPPSGRTTVKPLGVIFQVKDCLCQATPQYNPVCGTDGNTYVNRQRLLCARKCGFDVEEDRMGACDS